MSDLSCNCFVVFLLLHDSHQRLPDTPPLKHLTKGKVQRRSMFRDIYIVFIYFMFPNTFHHIKTNENCDKIDRLSDGRLS